MTTETLERPQIETKTGSGDPEFAHWVRKKEIPDAYVFGTPLVALCGKIWVPTRDPDRFPICPECKEIAAQAWPGRPERD